jgi:hypothetical protein
MTFSVYAFESTVTSENDETHISHKVAVLTFEKMTKYLHMFTALWKLFFRLIQGLQIQELQDKKGLDEIKHCVSFLLLILFMQVSEQVSIWCENL